MSDFKALDVKQILDFVTFDGSPEKMPDEDTFNDATLIPVDRTGRRRIWADFGRKSVEGRGDDEKVRVQLADRGAGSTPRRLRLRSLDGGEG